MNDHHITVLLVGIDAACARILDPLLDNGTVPTLASLAESGVTGPLQSQIPPWTASAWPSLYAGTNPGKHGVFGFLKYNGYEWDVVNASHVDEPALWELADLQGLQSVVVNVPITAPPTPIKGAVIPGYTAPEQPPCHPKGILEEIQEVIGDYRIYPRPDADQPAEYISLIKQRGAAFRYLAEKYQPDFGFIQFQQTDSVFHEYPDNLYIEEGGGMVESIYRSVDSELAAIFDLFDVGTVLVVSDHGIGPSSDIEFRMNECLREQEYVKSTTGDMPAWLPILHDHLREGKTDTNSGIGWIGPAIAAASSLGLTPARAGRVLRALHLDGIVQKIVPVRAQRAGRKSVDFTSSTAYTRSWIELGIRINLAGREPNGVVEPSAYETVRSDLIELLRSVELPDGSPVFETVCKREKIFHGPHTDDAVDIITVPTNFDTMLSADLKGSVFGPAAEPWNHKLDGLFIASGDAIGSTKSSHSAHLFDIAPTVCSALSIPRSDRMDGQPLPFVCPTGIDSYPKSDRIAKPTQNKVVENRLADLGYLEGGE